MEISATGSCCDSSAGDSCCGAGSAAAEAAGGFSENLYREGETDGLPEEAVLASLGCGNPLAVADLHEGERVLDLGSGGGIDVLLSARRVGPSGFAYGVDMTDEMLTLARANAVRAGAGNVEFLKGQIEALPLPEQAVDVVISNCVINLSTDKPAVLAEMFRVLVPGGRIGITDVVAEDHLTRRPRCRWLLCRLHRWRPVPLGVPGRPRSGRVRGRVGHLYPRGSPRHALSDHPGRQACHRIRASGGHGHCIRRQGVCSQPSHRLHWVRRRPPGAEPGAGHGRRAGPAPRRSYPGPRPVPGPG